MAFYHPTQAQVTRPTARQEVAEPSTPYQYSPQQQHHVGETEEWILFPPRHTDVSTFTQPSSTDRTPRTAGLSRLSDFGSFVARSGHEAAAASTTTENYVDEDGELDSLDEGLHAFQVPASPQQNDYFDQSASILPRHDGLGTFPASSTPMQEQLWSFEKYNPRKRSISGHTRNRSSVQRKLDLVEQTDATVLDGERRERIERWRTEQSRVFFDEVEKETRRRRSSVFSQEQEGIPSTAGLENIIKDSMVEHAKSIEKEQVQNESIWQRITRRVIHDFIALDDATMSVIFGETLPQERPIRASTNTDSSNKSIRLDPSLYVPTATIRSEHFLKRLAHQLGLLFDRFSMPSIPLAIPFNSSMADYAGIPIATPTSSKLQSQPFIQPYASLTFAPTLPQSPLRSATSPPADPALWGIEEEPPFFQNPEPTSPSYWEERPTIFTIFRLLHYHLTAGSNSSRPSATQNLPSATTKSNLNVATTSTPDSLRRAAIIRQHHPLLHQYSRQQRRHSSFSLMKGRSGGSSCASSARRARGSSLASSSTRNYWDIGASAGVGSGGAGSMIGNGAGIGAWGEV